MMSLTALLVSLNWGVYIWSIAVAAVLIRTVGGGVFLWIVLTLAFSFAAYGYLRKTVNVGPTQGFPVEVVLLSPPAIAYLA